ncbi:hypothetical protein [Macrococcus sp. DPC7161]|uniref:hypothetical protein n=1 Tax=Macrococcus sp. DPC7161 TaxID=2507060 RepID=UPI00100BFC59|nr:hypothetical protein [Macrococcus sp. DPC7161]RXK17630.1 hypothetical protein ER639_08810 [Macrococcus sp. DPC7161]
MDENKSLEERNKEIEAQLLHELEHGTGEPEKKQRHALLSVMGIMTLIFVIRMFYNLIKMYI